MPLHFLPERELSLITDSEQILQQISTQNSNDSSVNIMASFNDSTSSIITVDKPTLRESFLVTRNRNASIGFMAENSSIFIEEEFERVVLTRMPKYRWMVEQNRTIEEKQNIIEEFYNKIDCQDTAPVKEWIKRLREESCTADDLECLADVLAEKDFGEIEFFVEETGIAQLIQTCKAKSFTELFQHLNHFTMTESQYQTEPVLSEGHSFYLSIARLMNIEPWELAMTISDVLGIDHEQLGEWPVAERFNEEAAEWVREWSMEEIQCVANHINSSIRIWVIEDHKMAIDCIIKPEKLDDEGVDKFVNLF